MDPTIRTGVLSSEQCDMIIAEASPFIQPVHIKTWSCDAWAVRPSSLTAKVLSSRRLPIRDAQVVCYETGGSYGWHRDDQTRKRSHIAMLSDPDDYEGGLLEFDGEDPVGLARGTVISFPSQHRHRVQEVTSGYRWVAVMWESV